ncbi:tubulin/FtsZ family, GTPase domain protein (macronuclear) [Tetrahymena thermophila SB210]|uniref:Tubulin/FtsZ family, GTPase domain protein n=1 Tax=Tetrahymena thermophila (strain SB210) TaxID=312017 RepID=I7LY16_TETTS|nr:tubulin/FtsZ family, GTPase domain protein [Tetrahymena thermophila SB210]EAS07180.1 tubulin/FtsZ family, GTPase domain protein [Tetrahymena thermophila SB210]|eukprot:XP_001027422.1 tubulin/FtsZ family, GTPase domain protein [Tetrahymena thermophila SB210]
MGEIINVFVGQYGVQSGQEYWKQICLEHNINSYGQKLTQQQDDNENVTCFFSESEKQKYVPRCVFLDLDATPIDEIRKKSSSFFRKDCLISGKEDCGSNCVRGKYTLGKEICDIALDQIRLEANKCENLQGFIIHRSLNGGTGNGVGNLICDRLSRDYNKKVKINSLLFPSNNIANEVVEPFNFVLGMYDILEHQEMSLSFQNEQIYKFADNYLDIEQLDYQNINQLTSIINSSLTHSMRFKGDLNYNMANLVTNLVCYPRINNTIPSYCSSNFNFIKEKCGQPTVNMLCSSLFNKQNFFVDCNPQQGKYLSCCLTARGDIYPRQISESIKIIKSKQSIDFVDFIPTGIKVGVCQKQPKNLLHKEYESKFQRDAILLANNTSINSIFQIMAQKFNKMYDKRAFVHWYVGEGMESDEFACARENLLAIIKDYEEVSTETNENFLEEDDDIIEI